MKQIIMDVLDDMSESQINLASETARETVSSLISAALKTKGSYKEYTDYELDEQKARASWVCSICGENTFEVDSDYIGSGTNHLGCELKSETKSSTEPVQTLDDGGGITHRENEPELKFDPITEELYTDEPYEGLPEDIKQQEKEDLQKQAYLEMTSDGLPEGGDAQAVIESHKLADEIVDNKGKWIYESPDGGKTVFRRPFSDYDSKNKEEIDWETKKPTGRKFTEYNNGNWRSKDEG